MLFPLLTLLAVLDIVLVGVDLQDMVLEEAVGVLVPSWESAAVPGPMLDVDILVDVLQLDVLLVAEFGGVATSRGSGCQYPSLLLAPLERDSKPLLRKFATELLRRLAVRENDEGVGVWLRLLALLEREERRQL